jgi:tRNA threonylcarbamoyladenosine biosynthesis protein TsaE
MEISLKSLPETIDTGRRIGSFLRAGDVVTLRGPLGVGKTALVGGIASGMGIDPGYPVTSPTYVFAHIYEGRIPLHHIDLYRVGSEAELAGIGLEELLGGDGVAAVEWFDRFPSLWIGDRLEVGISFGENEERRLDLRGVGPRGVALERSIAEGA